MISSIGNVHIFYIIVNSGQYFTSELYIRDADLSWSLL